jgi:RNA polymerase sigma factor (sigma-70 family)
LKGNLKYTDDELLNGIKIKNTVVLELIFRDYFPSIRQMVLLNSGTKSDADDVFQDALIILYRKVREDNFRLSSSLKTYLYSISRHIWLKELRRRERMAILTGEDELPVEENDWMEEEIKQEERERLYREKYEELSEDCKKILKMFVLGTPISEITILMGYSSEQHTRNRRFKCKEALIQKIKNAKLKNGLGNENYRDD